MYHCAINSDAYQYYDLFEINQIENIFKFSKAKLQRNKTIFKWELNTDEKYYNFKLKMLMQHIFCHIWESFKWTSQEIFSSLVQMYINNLNELINMLKSFEEKEKIKEIILSTEPLFISIKNTMLSYQKEEIQFNHTKDFFDEEVLQNKINQYKELINLKQEMFQDMNLSYEDLKQKYN